MRVGVKSDSGTKPVWGMKRTYSYVIFRARAHTHTHTHTHTNRCTHFM